MADVAFPILLLTDKTLFEELSAVAANTAKQLAARKMPNGILIYEICDAPEWAHQTVKGSANPERMLVVTFQPEARNTVTRALAEVGKLHPATGEKKKTSLSMKANTPLRNFYKQMAEVPLTMFQLSHEKAPGSAMFFLRTAAVVAEFQRQLPAAFAADQPAGKPN